MAQRSKAYKAAKAAIGEDLYSPVEAIRLAKETNPSKTDATVEVALRLSVDPRKADQMVRGSVSLPHGTGKTARVVVFATGDRAEAARAAGNEIADARVASFHYTLTDDSGTVLDKSPDAQPLQYLHGAGNIVPGLEKALTGRKVGDAFEANLSLAMTGVDPEALASNAQAGLQTAGVQALSLEWRDLSLTRRALAMQARQSGREPEVIAADLARQLPQMAALFAGNHAGIQQVAKAVGEHLIDPSKVLRIDIRSGAAGGVSMAQVVGGYHPAGLAGLLEVSARAE